MGSDKCVKNGGIRMRKKVLGVTMLLLAVLSGCGKEKEAESPPKGSAGDTLIGERLGVPDRYTFENVSESGKSKVVVDADIIVPEVYGADIIEAIPVTFSEEEIRAFIRQHTGDFEWYDGTNGKAYSGQGFTKEVFGEDLIGIQSYSMLLTNSEESDQGDAYREIDVSFWLDEKTGEIANTPALTYTNSPGNPEISIIVPLNEENMADGCTISLEEAIYFADAEAEFLSPDFTLFQYGQMAYGEGVENSPRYYAFKYTREINGIPVNADIARGVGDGSGYTSGTERLWLTVNDAGVCWLGYSDPTQNGEVVAENVALLSFQEIRDIFEKVSMLSIKHLEIYDNLVENVMDIREIRFGYMAVKQSESIGGYRYLPVWDFYGVHWPVYENATYYPETFDDPVFTINAIDGTVIDRDMGY